MLEDTYAHSPLHKMFDNSDVYGIGYDEQRASRKPVRLAIIGCGGVAQSKHIPAIMRLKTIWEPIELVGVSVRNAKQGTKVAGMYQTTWYADYRQMLDDARPDGVLVLGPDDLHYEFTMECFKRGMHVLVEKQKEKGGLYIMNGKKILFGAAYDGLLLFLMRGAY